MSSNAALSRFYGFSVDDAVNAARTERYTLLDEPDLFVAHCKSNYGYFGSLDKTLSGFVILDDHGDDFYLLDVRDGGAVWFQDHEDRSFTRTFDCLEDYVGWRDELTAARTTAREDGTDVDTDGIMATWRTTSSLAMTNRVVSTAALAERLQWAVWFFAQPTRDIGTDNVKRETSTGIGWFLDQLGVDHRPLFDKEAAELHDDVALTCSWLLVAGALADHDLLEEIVGKGPVGVALVDAFAAAFRATKVEDTLAVLPVFAHRKSQLLIELAIRGNDNIAEARYARGLRASPGDDVLMRARMLSTRDAAVARATAGLVSDHAVGRLVLAHLDVKNDPARVQDIDAVWSSIIDSTEPSNERGWHFAALSPAFSAQQIVDGANRLLVDDPYHFGLLEQLARAKRALGHDDADAVADLHARLAPIRPVYNLAAVSSDAASVKAGLEQACALDDAARLLLTQRVLAASTSFNTAMIANCLQWSLAHPYAERAAHWRNGLGAVGRPDDVVKAWREQMPEPDDVVVADLRAVLAGPIPVKGAKILQDMARDDIVKAVTSWLATRQGPAIIEELVERLEVAGVEERKELIQTALNPFAKNGAYRLQHFTAAQADRAARVLVDIQRAGKGAHNPLFAIAGHQLYRFNHVGGEALITEALGNAEGEGLGKSDLVDNLYAALRSMGTPSSRASLIERLFSERQSFWRLSSALKDIWNDEVQAACFAAIVARKDTDGVRGANHLTATIVEHLEKTEPLLALADLVVDWTPRAGDRAHHAYTLLAAARAALLDKRYAEARRFIDAADALGVEPVSDYHDIDRGTAWQNPFVVDEAMKHLREQLLDGTLQREQDKARVASEKAKTTRKPLLKITDAALTDLAGIAIDHRLFHDKERGTIWAVGKDGRFVFFDGFDVVTPPFSVALDPDLGAFVAEASTFSERAAFWTKTATAFVDVARFGRHVFVGQGVNNGQWERFGFVFDDDDSAAAAVARLRASPLKGYAESDPWYVPGKGGIVRILYVPNADGSYSSDREWVHAVEHDDVDAAEATYWRVGKTPGARVISVEWMDRYQRDAEGSVLDALKKRVLLEDVLATLPKLGAVLTAAGFDDVIAITTTPPEPAAVLDKLQLVLHDPTRAALRAIYEQVGSLRVVVGDRLVTLEPLSTIVDGTEVFSQRAGFVGYSDQRLKHVRQPQHLIMSFIPDAVHALLPEVEGRRFNAAPGDDVEHVHLQGLQSKSPATLWATLDPTHAAVTVREGRVGAPPKIKLHVATDADDARAWLKDLIKKREAKGWTITR